MRLTSLRFSPRTRTIVFTALGVVALAGVIFGLAAISKPKRPVPTPPVTVSGEGGARLLATQAQDALSRGDTDTAQGLADKALQRDPGNATARKVVDTIEKTQGSKDEQADSSSSEDDSSPQSSSKPKPSSKPTAPVQTPALFFSKVDDLGRLLPGSVPGFDVGNRLAEGRVAQVILDPGGSDSGVYRGLLTVHDFETTKAATEFSSRISSKVFSRSTSKVSLGDVSAYFGSNGERLASIQFSRGRYAFEVVLTARSGDPAKLRSVATDIARTFPTK